MTQKDPRMNEELKKYNTSVVGVAEVVGARKPGKQEGKETRSSGLTRRGKKLMKRTNGVEEGDRGFFLNQQNKYT